jgi:hypothetical protein
MTRPNFNLTPEQQSEAERIFEVLQVASKEEQWRIAQLLASKRDDQIFGQTEYEVRDLVHKIGAKAIQTALQGRKKGGTKDPV